MSIERIAVLGGGPGGLYAARLLKLADPTREVTVHEQGVPDKTFGFGVGLAGRTQRNLDAADPDSLRDIVAAGRGHHMEMRVGADAIRIHNENLIAIARTELLAILQRHAENAGVHLRFGEQVEPSEVDADLVVAADGVNSNARRRFAAEFGASVESGSGFYLWCGADFALESALFSPVQTEFGTFVTHAYPYSAELSTFLIETDEQTWRRAGFDRTTSALGPSESDTEALAYLEKIFSEQLGGHRLIGNRTRWLRFRTVRAARWRHGNTVLLGDAAHTAHYSIGSGTKLAMEDAIALCTAVSKYEDLDVALASYEQQRKPAVQRLQELARRSQLWWESFPDRMHLPVAQLMLAYMTRAGNVSIQRFLEGSPDAANQGLMCFAGERPSSDPDRVYDWVLDQPLSWGEQEFPARVLDQKRAERFLRSAIDDPVSPDEQDEPRLVCIADQPTNPWSSLGELLVQRCIAAVRAGVAGFWLSGSDSRDAVLTRLDLAERLRLATGGLVVVQGPREQRADLAAGIASGRADLLAFDEEFIR